MVSRSFYLETIYRF